MKSRHFCVRIDLFDWEVFYYIVDKTVNKAHLTNYLRGHQIEEKQILNTVGKATAADYLDGGEHHYFEDETKSLIVIFRASSPIRQVSTIAHENRHAADNICDTLGIDDIETPAYIEGFLMEQVLKQLKK